MKVLGIVVLLGGFSFLGSCRTIKPYEKEYLLSPLMDDTKFSPVAFDFSSRVLPSVEKLSASSASSSSGSSCPTCGG